MSKTRKAVEDIDVEAIILKQNKETIEKYMRRLHILRRDLPKPPNDDSKEVEEMIENKISQLCEALEKIFRKSEQSPKKEGPASEFPFMRQCKPVIKWTEEDVQQYIQEIREMGLVFAVEGENFRGLTGFDLLQFTQQEFIQKANSHVDGAFLFLKMKDLRDEWLDPSGGLEFKITDCMTETDGKPFTVYEVTVSTPSDSWIVKLRYSQFSTLHEQMKKENPSIDFPPFPGKKIFGTMSQKTVEERRKDLEKYLQSLLISQKLKNSEAFKTYLDPEGKLSQKAPKEVS